MPRYKLTIEYDGAPFCGWQVQADQISVQGVLTGAIEALSGQKTLVQGAGRTDAGVHARAQVAHVDLAKDWDTDTVRDALNAHLRPHPIAILSAERAADDFNARTSAVKRHYLYRIINRRADLTLEAGYAWRVPRPLDANAMHEAAQRLVGKHDFTTFRSTECQAKSPVKTLDVLAVERNGEEIKVERGRPRQGAQCARPRRVRSSGPAGRALSDEGRLLSLDRIGPHRLRRHVSRPQNSDQ
jgi:tRNA pseudouridine38-40 synthase